MSLEGIVCEVKLLEFLLYIWVICESEQQNTIQFLSVLNPNRIAQVYRGVRAQGPKVNKF